MTNNGVIQAEHEHRFNNAWWIAILAIGAIVSFSAYNFGQAQDNDMWWLFATGREIVENGIPYMNPFSAFGDQAIVVQQWIPAVIDYLLYSNFGFIGIGTMVLIETLLLAFVAWKLMKEIGSGKTSELCAVVLALMVGVCSSYLSVRPQVWSMIGFLLIITVLERHRRTGNWKVLIWLPIITLIHINFHMSMAPYDLFIIACYIVPSFGKKAVPLSHSWKLIIVLIICALTMLINPYGLDGALYLVNSYGSADYGNYISEMGQLTPWSAYYGQFAIASMIIGAIAIGKNGTKNLDSPLTILFIVAAALSLQHVRNVWLVGIFGYAIFCSAYAGKHLHPSVTFMKDDPIKLVLCSVSMLSLCCVSVTSLTPEVTKTVSDTASTPVEAVNYLDSTVENKNETKIFTHFNSGGYLEWAGYKVGMDARPETWDSNISKNGNDRYKEYCDMSKNNISVETYLTGKDYDYLIVNTDTSLYRYLSSSSQYTNVKNGNGYAVFTRG